VVAELGVTTMKEVNLVVEMLKVAVGALEEL
jgi:hypothetical protein